MAKGDISGFVTVMKMSGNKALEWRKLKVKKGYVFAQGGFSTKKCANCGVDAVVGFTISPKCDPLNGDMWADVCALCGTMTVELAVYKI